MLPKHCNHQGDNGRSQRWYGELIRLSCILHEKVQAMVCKWSPTTDGKFYTPLYSHLTTTQGLDNYVAEYFLAQAHTTQ